jgi:hypothetical protein
MRSCARCSISGFNLSARATRPKSDVLRLLSWFSITQILASAFLTSPVLFSFQRARRAALAGRGPVARLGAHRLDGVVQPDDFPVRAGRLAAGPDLDLLDIVGLGDERC